MKMTRAMKWLPDMDLNHDKQIQSLLCYRYTIGQTRVNKVEVAGRESRLQVVRNLFHLELCRALCRNLYPEP